MDAIDEADRAALSRAFKIASRDAKQRSWIEQRLADGDTWENTARSCAVYCQGVNLVLQPWQLAPLSYDNANDPDNALRQPYGDARGAREAVEILQKLLALGLSRFEPNPL